MFLIHDHAKLDWLEIRFEYKRIKSLTSLESAARYFSTQLMLDFIPARPIRFFPTGVHLGRHKGVNFITEITLRCHVSDLDSDSDFVYCTITGENAEKHADFLFSADLHSVTVSRCDVAYDFTGGFWPLANSIEQFAKSRSIDSNRISSSHKNVDCVTQYIGSRKYSPTYVRLYQKGFQMGVDDEDWNRLEFEIRPKRLSPEIAAAIWYEIKNRQWESVTGLNKWCVDMCRTVIDLPTYYTPTKIERNLDIEKSFLYLVKQYNKIFTGVASYTSMDGFVQLMADANLLSESGRSDEIPELVYSFIHENERSEKAPPY